jgi:hypothetical protein
VDRSLLGILKELGPPRYAAFGTRKRNADEQANALSGRFQVFVKIEELSELEPPIDWRQDPFDSPPWCAQLHTLRFLDVLYSAPNQFLSGAHARALAIVLDWVASNPRESPRSEGSYAWSDKVAGDRAPFIGYLLRAAGARSELSEGEAAMLLAAAAEHGEFLADPEHYVAGSNHGPAMDAGLILLANYLPFLEQASAWRQTAIQRFTTSLRSRISPIDKVHLEHSLDYHVMVANLAIRLRDKAGLREPELDSIIDDLGNSGAWFVAPDGRVPGVGDSDNIKAPRWMRERTSAPEGMRLFHDAGYAVVSRDDSYLLVSAGHHSVVHKQADDLSFVLYEHGTPIVGDAGKYGYSPKDPGRIHARSCFAHNGLFVDGEDFNWKWREPYGSGILAGGSGDGWHAVRATNPLVLENGVTHHRTFAYLPGEILLVIDEIDASADHDYCRLVHMAPGTSAHLDGSFLRFSKGEVVGSVTDVSPHQVQTSIACGEREPRLRGWAFPGYREWEPVPTAVFEARGVSVVLAYSIALGDQADLECEIERQDETLVVGFRSDDGPRRLQLRQRGRLVEVAADS